MKFYQQINFFLFDIIDIIDDPFLDIQTKSSIMIQVYPSNNYLQQLEINMAQSIFIKKASNQSVALTVDLMNDTLNKVVQHYADKTGVDENTILLYFKRKPLFNQKMGNMKLQDLKIQNKSTLVVFKVKDSCRKRLRKIQTVDNQTHTLLLNSQVSISRLKAKIYNNLCKSLTPSWMSLKCGNIQLKDDKKLSDYEGINENCKIVQQKQRLSKIPGIQLTSDSDIWGLEEEQCTKMPCGHVVGRDGMTGFVKTVIDDKASEIKCPEKINGRCCNQLWPFWLCKKIGVFTREETKDFEERISINYIKKMSSQCPECQKRVIKGSNIKHNKVKCPCCNYGAFCYLCLQPWQSSDLIACGNQSCWGKNKILQQTPFDQVLTLKENQKTQSVQIPKFRACPNCHIIIEFIKGCKHMKCEKKGGGCGEYFCWVCLEIKDEYWKCGSYDSYCGKIAPAQIIE